MAQVLSSRLVADYTELANRCLDHIEVDTVREFPIVIEALQSMLAPNRGRIVPPRLWVKLESIRELLNSPELYVQDQHHYDEYRQIIQRRLAAKINELSTFNDAEKQRYLTDQQHRASQYERYRRITCRALPPIPGSEAHVISDEEQWRLHQERFRQEGNRRNHESWITAVIRLLVAVQRKIRLGMVAVIDSGELGDVLDRVC